MSADPNANPSQADPERTKEHTPDPSLGLVIEALLHPSETAVGAEAIPGYRLLGRIGKGGMGLVYAARDLTLDREVAVKVLLPETPDWKRAGAATRFVTESKITARLPHPNIPPVYALGTLEDGLPFLAMKLIRGKTLAELLKDRTSPAVDQSRYVQVFEQICQAVGFAHSVGVIHRDLKPGNVMVGAFGEVQVMDWGLAKVLANSDREQPGNSPTHSVDPTSNPVVATPDTARKDDEETPPASPRDGAEVTTARILAPADTPQTQAGAVMGTAQYMAPEQARGEALGPSADVFALGGILCSILTGRPPFDGANRPEVVRRAAAGEVSSAFAALDACGADAELVSLCKRCLNPKQPQRPANGSVVAELVSAYRVGVEDRARKAETERAAAEAEAREQRKRRKVQLALAIAVFALVAMVAAGAWWRNHTNEQARFKTEQARERAVNLLRFAEDARKEYRYSTAESALNDAGELVEKFELDIGREIDQAKAGLAFVRELDAIRMKRSTWIADAGGKGHFDESKAPGEYRAAFLTRGLDVGANPDAVSKFVSASAVRTDLVTALDDWAILEPDEAVRDKVLSVLWQADGDSGAAPFRDPAVWKDKAKLGALAGKVDVARMSPGAVVAVAEVMRKQGLDASPILRHAMSLHPRDFHVAFSLGQILYFGKDNKNPEAIGAYRTARAIRLDNAAALINLGIALEFSGDLPGSIAAFRDAIRINSKHATAHSCLGVALADSGDVAGAIASFKEATRLDPEDAKAHTNLGNVLKVSGDLPGAIAAHKEAIRLNPSYAPAHYNLGNALAHSEDLSGAIASYKQAIRLNPKYAPAHSGLGNAMRLSGAVTVAIATYREAIRLNPTDAPTHNNLGIALLDSGDAPSAVTSFRESVRLNPSDGTTHYNLGNALRGSGDVAGAIAAYKEAIRLNPRYALAHSNLGGTLAGSGDVPGAIAAFKEAIRLDPKLAMAHANLGFALRASGDVTGGRVAYAEAVRLDPKRYRMRFQQLFPPPIVAPPPREK